MNELKPRMEQQERWLADAAKTLAEAERLTGLLALARPWQDMALASLQAEIMTLRREIERAQRERAGERRRDFHPDWMKYSVWPAAAS